MLISLFLLTTSILIYFRYLPKRRDMEERMDILDEQIKFTQCIKQSHRRAVKKAAKTAQFSLKKACKMSIFDNNGK